MYWCNRVLSFSLKWSPKKVRIQITRMLALPSARVWTPKSLISNAEARFCWVKGDRNPSLVYGMKVWYVGGGLYFGLVGRTRATGTCVSRKALNRKQTGKHDENIMTPTVPVVVALLMALRSQGPGSRPVCPTQSIQVWVNTGLLTSTCLGQSRGGEDLVTLPASPIPKYGHWAIFF